LSEDLPVVLIMLVGGILFLVYSNLPTTRLKCVRRIIVLLPLLLGLLLTTLVHAASADASSGEQTYEQQQFFNVLQIGGISLIVLGVYAALHRLRYSSMWLPNDAPFEAYKPFKPAYTSTFPSNPIPPPPLFESSALSLSEAARYLRVSEHDVRMLIDEGSIIAMKRGATYLVTRRALDDFAHSEKFGL
jgi:excisionase family DNA binding protein